MTCSAGYAVYRFDAAGNASCAKSWYTTTESEARYARKISCTTVKSARQQKSGGTTVNCPSGYTMTGGGMINHYRTWGQAVTYEDNYPSGNGWACDSGIGWGDYTCYVRCCRFY